MLRQSISHFAGSFSALIRDLAEAQPAGCLNTEKWQRGCGVETAFHSSAVQLGLLTSEIILLKYRSSRNSHSNLKLLELWFLILAPSLICCFDFSHFQQSMRLAAEILGVSWCISDWWEQLFWFFLSHPLYFYKSFSGDQRDLWRRDLWETKENSFPWPVDELSAVPGCSWPEPQMAKNQLLDF